MHSYISLVILRYSVILDLLHLGDMAQTEEEPACGATERDNEACHI